MVNRTEDFNLVGQIQRAFLHLAWTWAVYVSETYPSAAGYATADADCSLMGRGITGQVGLMGHGIMSLAYLSPFSPIGEPTFVLF